MRGFFSVMGALALTGCGPFEALFDQLDRDAEGPNVLLPELVTIEDGIGQLYTARLARVALVADHTERGLWAALPRAPYFLEREHGFEVVPTMISIRQDGRWIAASAEEYLSDTLETKVYIWRADMQTAQASTTDNIIQGHAERICDFASLHADNVALTIADDPNYDPAAPVTLTSLGNSGGPLGEFSLAFAGWTAGQAPVLAINYAQTFEIGQQGVAPEQALVFDTDFTTYYITYERASWRQASLSTPVDCSGVNPALPETASRLDVISTSPARGVTGLAVEDTEVVNYLAPDRPFTLRRVVGPISGARILQD